MKRYARLNVGMELFYLDTTDEWYDKEGAEEFLKDFEMVAPQFQSDGMVLVTKGKEKVLYIQVKDVCVKTTSVDHIKSFSTSVKLAQAKMLSAKEVDAIKTLLQMKNLPSGSRKILHDMWSAHRSAEDLREAVRQTHMVLNKNK